MGKAPAIQRRFAFEQRTKSWSEDNDEGPEQDRAHGEQRAFAVLKTGACPPTAQEA
jgi:hypothetical protein